MKPKFTTNIFSLPLQLRNLDAELEALRRDLFSVEDGSAQLEAQHRRIEADFQRTLSQKNSYRQEVRRRRKNNILDIDEQKLR